jgi:hypothetical protein
MDDERCCGTGTCIINPEGYCWCGQKWDGQKMSFPDLQVAVHATPHERSNAATTSVVLPAQLD